jgi:hypothetical protein
MPGNLKFKLPSPRRRNETGYEEFLGLESSSEMTNGISEFSVIVHAVKIL